MKTPRFYPGSFAFYNFPIILQRKLPMTHNNEGHVRLLGAITNHKSNIRLSHEAVKGVGL